MTNSELRPTDIRTVWDVIRPRLEVVRARSGGEWRVEDVYAACVNGTAFLWMDDGVDFAVLQLNRADFSQELECFIWAAYNAGDLAAHTRQVVEIAQEAGATRLVMISARSGWDRRPEWKKLHSTYAMEI
jgi:hypothetical protein